jgi:hypothetical protein
MITWVSKFFQGSHTASKMAVWEPTHQHRKGGEYRVISEGVLEADRIDVVIYDDADGTVWVRSKTEFFDGRFSELK